jgi:chromosome segregation ATPase
MQVSDEQLKACCKAYTDSKCATWEPSPAAMRAALAVLPDLTAERDQLLRDVAEDGAEIRRLHDSLSLALAERDQRSAELAECKRERDTLHELRNAAIDDRDEARAELQGERLRHAHTRDQADRFAAELGELRRAERPESCPHAERWRKKG